MIYLKKKKKLEEVIDENKVKTVIPKLDKGYMYTGINYTILTF